MSQKKCLSGYFCVTFCADHFPQIRFFIAPTWGRFWPIFVFGNFQIFAHFLCVFCVFLVYVAPHSYQQMLGLWCHVVRLLIVFGYLFGIEIAPTSGQVVFLVGGRWDNAGVGMSSYRVF